MDNLYARRWYFYTLMVVALAFGVIFFTSNNLDFIIAAVQQEKFSPSNIAYAVIRCINGIFIPLVFIAPSVTQFSKIKTIKTIYIINGLLYFVTLSWIITFLCKGYNLLEYDDIHAFQSTFTNAYIASYVFWDTYTLTGVVYSVIYGLLYIYTGITFDDNKKKVKICVILILVLKILLPVISNLCYGKELLSLFWLANNYSDIISTLAYTLAICVASYNDTTWVDFIWDQRQHNGISKYHA